MSKRAVTVLLIGAVIAPIILYFAYTGVTKAWSDFTLSSLEASYNANVAAMDSTHKACDLSYTALMNYKQDNNIQLSNAGSACSFR